MKKLLWACALALPILALPNQAHAFMIGNYEVDSGAKVWCNVRQFNICTPTAGPWYLYYPYQAYFQVPAPGVSPYFAPMTLPPGFGPPAGPPPGYGPPPGPPMMPPALAYQPQMPQAPQGYYQQRQAPQGYYQQPQAPQGYYQQPQAPQGYYQQPQAAQGYYPRLTGQTSQPMTSMPTSNYRAPAPAGIPHPDVFSYYNNGRQ